MTNLQTFDLPESITGTQSDKYLAHQMIQAWRTDGIFQIATNTILDLKTSTAFEASRKFFRMPLHLKQQCISDLTYGGYIACGEEITAGEFDYSEILTICKDVPLDDPRVQAQWPCHGPMPWPSQDYHQTMKAFTDELGLIGNKLLLLIALGLELDDINTLTRLTDDGWHHMRVLRFPASNTKQTRGIGAHTDYGLLVIASQDLVGGLYIRPPVLGETRNRNWLPTESSAGMYENEEPWIFVEPRNSVLTVFPGDILQFITNGYLLSTPHQVKLNTSERFSFAYFHEPNFDAFVHPLRTSSTDQAPLGQGVGCGVWGVGEEIAPTNLGYRATSFQDDSITGGSKSPVMQSSLHPAPYTPHPILDNYIHYGTHFTNMFTRCYPNRITTRRIQSQDRLSVLTTKTNHYPTQQYCLRS